MNGRYQGIHETPLAVLGQAFNRAAVPPENGATATELPLSQLRDTEECAVTPDVKKHEKRPPDSSGDRTGRADELGSLEVWARSAPIRLAGYEDDLAEPHILPGID